MNSVVMLLHVRLLTESLCTLLVKTSVAVPGVTFVLRMIIESIYTIKRIMTLDAIKILLSEGTSFFNFTSCLTLFESKIVSSYHSSLTFFLLEFLLDHVTM